VDQIERQFSAKKKKKVKPSIPSRKMAKNGYSGLDNDTPGPSGYNPKD
jgi:hypothetical protein